MHKLREPTEKQLKLAESLEIATQGKSFRVLSAEITDALEVKSFSFVGENGIKSGIKVRYLGLREDMPRDLVVSTVAKSGYLYFKGTSKYCRPWEVQVVEL